MNTNLTELSNAQLVSHWNERVKYAESIGLTGHKPINSKFKDTPTALKRIAALESDIRAREASNRAVDKEEKATPVAPSAPVASEPAGEQPSPQATTTEDDDMAKRKGKADKKTRQKAASQRTRAPRANGDASIADKTEEFNGLVARANKAGITWARHHSSLFGSHEAADKMLKKLYAELG